MKMTNSKTAVKTANTNTSSAMADLVESNSFVPTLENLFDTSTDKFTYPNKPVKGVSKKQAIENISKYANVSYPVGGDYNSKKWQDNIVNLNVSNQSLLLYCLVEACKSYNIKVSYKPQNSDNSLAINIDHSEMKLSKNVVLWKRWNSLMGYSFLSILSGQSGTNSQAVAGLILLLKNGLKFS